jgi:iron complex outermembrane receptor protein
VTNLFDSNQIIRSLACLKRASVLLLFVCLFSPNNNPLSAQSGYFQLDIKSGPANETLTRLAEETNTQLLFSLSQLEGLSTKTLTGTYSVRSALREMLRDSGLAASFDQNNIIVIHPAAVPPAPPREPDSVPAPRKTRSNKATKTRSVPIEEITVTARKWSEPLRSVPFSITALTEGSIFLSGAKNITDIARGVNGLTITDLGAGQSQIAIRGVSSGQVVRDQPGIKEQVGVYLDESAISTALFTPDLDLFDMQRFEVLRGPQGTLFGSGSLAGTVRYITNQPNLEKHEVFGELDAAVAQGGDLATSVKAGFNLPFAASEAALRSIFYYSEIAGYVDARHPDGSRTENINNGLKYGGRIAFTYAASEQLTVTPRVVYQSLETGGFPREDIYNVLANPFTQDWPTARLSDGEHYIQLEEGLTDEFLLVDTKIEYDFGPNSLTSITSIIDREVVVTRDSGQLTMSILAQPSGFNLSGDILTRDAPLTDATELAVFSQELRLASSNAGKLSYVLGAYFTDSGRNFGQTLAIQGFDTHTGLETSPSGALTDHLFYSRFRFDFRQWALFGEATYKITPTVSVTAGLRWFDYMEERSLRLDGLFAALGFNGNQTAKTVSDGLTPRFIVAFEPSENLQINAQIAKGFRLGGINDPLNTPLCTPDDFDTFGDRPFFDNEELWNYEIGFKSTFADGRLTFDVAAFYADINNLQATVDAGSCSSRIIFNIPEARSVGLEAEVFMQPHPNLDISFSATMQSAEIRSTLISESNVLDGISKGNRLPTSPTFQATSQFSYHWEMADNWGGFAALSLSYAGPSYSQIGDQVPGFGNIDLTIADFGSPSQSNFAFDPELPSYKTGNIRLGFRRGNLEISAYVTNFWNETIRTSLDRERGGLARIGYLIGRPRTIGISLRTHI